MSVARLLIGDHGAIRDGAHGVAAATGKDQDSEK
jgi:hypothetical protein